MISPVKIWRRQKVVRDHLGKVGTVLSWTRVMVPGVGFKDVAPYPVVIVEFEGGGRAVGQLVDCDMESVAAGMQVVGVLRKVRKPTEDGVIAYGLKFKPRVK